MKIKIFFIKLFNIIFGGYSCVRCNKPSGWQPICLECQKNNLFKYVSTFDKEGNLCRCRKCGKELISELECCSACKEKNILLHCDKVFPIHSYALWKKNLITLWKMHNVRQLSYIFADLLYEVINKEFSYKCNLPVVPVPPRPGKIKRIGWDQIQDICKILSKKYGLTVYSILERISSVQQKELGREGRLQTLDKAYRIKENISFPDNIPDTVILIDDVMTTGVTVETCAHCLKEVGIQNVYVVTLFSVS